MGIDGCRAGWVVVRATLTPFNVVEASVTPDLDGVMLDVDAGSVASVAVDMPIGLSEHGTRACDVMAREHLGPRRASIFPAPARGTLDAVDHTDAISMSRRLTGRGLSIQSWNLAPKIKALDELINPQRQSVVHESHPELAFTRIAGTPMTHNKRRREGREERLRALGLRGIDELPARPGGAAIDDLIDAMVLSHTAAALVDGTAWVLGDGVVDVRGLRMEICG